MASNEANDELEELDDSVDDYDQTLEYEYDDGIANSSTDDSEDDDVHWDSIHDEDSEQPDEPVSNDDNADYDELDD